MPSDMLSLILTISNSQCTLLKLKITRFTVLLFSVQANTSCLSYNNADNSYAYPLTGSKEKGLAASIAEM